MNDSYLTIEESILHKITRKKSRFIALLSAAASPDDVSEQLSKARKLYHDATHHCSAYRLLMDDALIEGSSDDGEPAGSAGMPMLHQLAGHDLCNVLAIVIRYYGGTNLGVGGLVRAYSDAVSEALEHVRIITQALLTHITIRFPVEVNSSVMSTLHRFPVQIEALMYEEPVRIECSLPPSQVNALRGALTEATGARVEMEVAL
ncbi:YigZ family protein [Candidatus Bipolaricaulota bacterium]|nr:YigZ family protein [Candidatus Bipolaricaulota bacterium]TFH11321.1 MAG: YigZ family protein [Candidatus Atribacteria bacterium]